MTVIETALLFSNIFLTMCLSIGQMIDQFD
jgi:hypothetical protein